MVALFWYSISMLVQIASMAATSQLPCEHSARNASKLQIRSVSNASTTQWALMAGLWSGSHPESSFHAQGSSRSLPQANTSVQTLLAWTVHPSMPTWNLSWWVRACRCIEKCHWHLAIIAGFSFMKRHESPRTPFDLFFNRFLKAPKCIVYDNCCHLHRGSNFNTCPVC